MKNKYNTFMILIILAGLGITYNRIKENAQPFNIMRSDGKYTVNILLNNKKDINVECYRQDFSYKTLTFLSLNKSCKIRVTRFYPFQLSLNIIKEGSDWEHFYENYTHFYWNELSKEEKVYIKEVLLKTRQKILLKENNIINGKKDVKAALNNKIAFGDPVDKTFGSNMISTPLEFCCIGDYYPYECYNLWLNSEIDTPYSFLYTKITLTGIDTVCKDTAYYYPGGTIMLGFVRSYVPRFRVKCNGDEYDVKLTKREKNGTKI
ncbi:MAG: hypothetical protein PHX21_13870 [bacterium]|nr:hypothetical protein [bacterium]